MGKVIDLHKPFKAGSNAIITSGPWEFRNAAWQNMHFIQMLRSQTEKLAPEGDVPRTLPPHFVLKGGLAYTIRAMYMRREDAKQMRDIYYLVGLMDCMINQVNPVLRTDLLRDMYNKVFEMKAALNIHWHGTVDQVLLPIDTSFYNSAAYVASLKNARTLKSLYGVIKDGTEEMFGILSAQYVFYCPWAGG